MDNDQGPTGPLAGIRVVDLTHIAAGPFATMLLADLGADVIKVERPGGGDGARQMDVSIHGDGDSGYYLGLNKNKRSIVLDLRAAQDVEVVRRLAATADVFIENFRPGSAERMGLGYADIRKVRKDIVYCSITGFGPSGHLRDGIAYDIVGQAMSGIMSITGDADRPPAKCGAPISDLTSGIFAALGIVSALYHRQRTGEGQHVGTSLLGASVALVSSYITSQALGTPFDRLGSAHNTLAPYQAFAGSDGRYFILAAGNDGFFARTAQLLGRPDLVTDQRFATNADRSRHRAELAELLQRAFERRDTEHWLRALGEIGVPASPIYDIADVAREPQLYANGYLTTVEHQTAGPLPMVTTPLTFSATPVSVRRPPPRLDEHHHEILREAAGSLPLDTTCG
ncbi:CoA transferase [Dactylosporangium sp. NPDC051485]|uniref:CaiB/BaiF CoA transferase family protein n=1 Tax=Dactylosporangium sp. NPDC051485 TaxID=3154846 RepID=UPI0034180CD0